MAAATSLATHELLQKGYRVIDMKPAHIILRQGARQPLLRDRHGQFAYALVDYELLERTPEHEQAVRASNRQLYLEHMARRFEADAAGPMPAHLRETNLMGVDYVFGRAESTGGLLWVVGKDPDLFNYFLPERWRRTPNKCLSSHSRAPARDCPHSQREGWDPGPARGGPSGRADHPAHHPRAFLRPFSRLFSQRVVSCGGASCRPGYHTLRRRG